MFARLSMAFMLVALIVAASCSSGVKSGSGPELSGPDQGDPASAGLLAVGELDRLKGTTEVHQTTVDVTAPLLERHTAINGDYLELTPVGTELAYAIYRVEPPAELLISIDGTCDGTMWLGVADYATGSWAFAPFQSGSAHVNLAGIGDPVSEEGYLYCAVVCGQGEGGLLQTLQLTSDDLGPWNLEITTDEDSVTLTWDELNCVGYEIYRSTLADDPFPYLVGYIVEDHDGPNTFTEIVPEDSLGRWVPENNENGTPEDTADDFPTVAPAVDYYYRVKAVLAVNAGPESPEVSGLVPWGGRSTTTRALPEANDRTQLFGMGLDVSNLTEAQIAWVAANMVGCTATSQSTIDRLRAHNPDFVVVGSHLSYLSCAEIQSYRASHDDGINEMKSPQIYGEELLDYDGAFPYISRHEDWYLHDTESEYYHNRVLSTISEYLVPYWMDMNSPWPDYVSSNLLQLNGEDSFDGWILDNTTSLIGMHPLLHGESIYDDAFHEYVQGVNTTLFSTIKAASAAHVKDPLIIADAWLGYGASNEGQELKLLDYSDCDVVIYSNFLGGGNGSLEADILLLEEFIGQPILDHQAAGRSVIMNFRDYLPEHWWDLMDSYCIFLLLRGPKAYFNSSPGYIHSTLWYPMYSWDSGAPLEPQPTSLADLAVHNEDFEGNPQTGMDYYRRDFENGFVLVSKYRIFDLLDEPMTFEYMEVSGGGAVDEDGNTTGTTQWIRQPSPSVYFSVDPGCYIFRVVDEP